MKIRLLILLSLGVYMFCFSYTIPEQYQKKNDPLWNTWQNETLADSTRLESLKEFIWKRYLFRQPDSAFYFAQQQYDFAEERGLKRFMANALDVQGISFSIRRQNDNALIHYQKALKIFEEADDKQGIADCLSHIGTVYSDRDNNLEALDYHLRSLKHSEDINYLKGISRASGNIGLIYRNSKDYDKAIEYYNKALLISEKLGDERTIGNSYFNIGVAHRKSGDLEKAIENFQEASEIQERIGDRFSLANTINSIGNVYLKQEEYDEALKYYKRSIRINEEINNVGGTLNAINNIGDIYLLKEQYRKAITNYNKSAVIAKELGEIDKQYDAYSSLYVAYKNLGNEDQALYYLEKTIIAKDSLNEVDTAKKLQQHEFDKERLQDSLQNEEAKLKTEMAHQAEVRKKEKNKNLALGAGIFFLLVSGGLYGRWRYTKKAKAVIEKEKDRSENLLLNILPAEVAEELKEKGEAEAQDFDMVSILFSDFKGFTGMSEKMTAKDLVANINECFKAFDATMQKYNIEKIKTIGDAYMAAGGLPVKTNDSVKNTVLAALEMQDFIIKLHKEKETKGEHAFEMRVGIHTGPVVAGIVGVKKFQYDIWGDTVNTASRMESHGEIGKVNISEDTYNYIKDEPEFIFESRGKIEAKGKGEVEMYFVSLK
ncbi:adenylate/guanylate cyclase domain-containing protein [Winogradskyella sp. 3972H.M.0a.05]|uniref:adenylate/guanylate cyclase domain-containing protein n=1 Tax=Winogradskyella sp. 3972H.M.0a.05 TaxID=2950277 RepID=UPI00339A0E30